ncbi:MAG: hypothetical protein JKY56_18810, partial [Kofleriaceae bacterium]|nr:hypothetical protein [Kofleriaceae bacterium]
APDAQIADARAPDAQIADAGAPDAQIADAGRVSDAQVTDSSVESDASTLGIATLSDAGNSRVDAGFKIAIHKSDAGTKTKRAPRWASLNMGSHAPAGDHIAVLLRLDRIRGTEWAKFLDDILRPMPDHRLIIGDRKLSFSDYFDFLYISTNNPADLTATTLSAISKLKGAELRKMLGHPKVKIKWSPVAAGVLGTLGASRNHHSADKRVYFSPNASSLVLARPSTLNKAIEPRTGALDLPNPQPELLPSWIENIPKLSQAASGADAPYAMAYISALPNYVVIPRGPTLPAPDSISIYLQAEKTGFTIRGKAIFSNAARAKQFAEGATKARSEAMNSMLTKILLRQFQAYNLLAGLKLEQKSSVVTFASTLSIADTRSIFKLAANWSRRYFGRQSAPPQTP